MSLFRKRSATSPRLSSALIFTFALIAAAPGLMPWALGFAVGSLVYLVLAELLPECYREAGSTSIALVTLVAMGMVALLVSLGPGG